MHPTWLIRPAAKPIIAGIFAALAFGAAPHDAQAQFVGVGPGLTITGGPGTLSYSANSTLGYFFATVGALSDIPVTINDAPGVLIELNWSDDLSNPTTSYFGSGSDASFVEFLQGSGELYVTDPSFLVTLAAANLGDAIISAVPGKSSPVILLEVLSPANAVDGYLNISGMTTSPVSVTTAPSCLPNTLSGDPCSFLSSFTFDWTATYQATPYVPTSGSAVPEPSTWTMMILGFTGLGFAGRRAWRVRAALAGRAFALVASSGLIGRIDGSGGGGAGAVGT